MNILERIVAAKKTETETRKKIRPVNELERSALFAKPVLSFFDSLNKKEPSVIAEFKRKSPSKGIINNNADVEQVAPGYFSAGVSAMSILTDKEFFGGSEGDLEKVAKLSLLPLLRKEFIIDEYQVIEAKSIGASAILLIGSILTREQIKNLSMLAFSLGMEVLFEIHDIADLDKMNPDIRIVGVNNRNLNTFKVDRSNSINMLSHLPKGCIKVAESGFESPEEVKMMFSEGYNSFLIGEKFMRSDDPGKSAALFISALK
jgi:indole-3-glycerol phosphate synthase